MGRAILIIGAGALLVGIWIYGLIDAARADKQTVRTLPKAAWVLITFLVPIIGCLLWLAFGRPRASRPVAGGRTASSGIKAPDDDEDYLRFLEQKARRQEESRKRQKDQHNDSDDTPEQE